MTIYIDELGNPEPRANISLFGGVHGRGGYLALCTTSDSPDNGTRWDNTPAAIATIAAWADARGYDIVESRDGYGAYRATLTHRETATALSVLRAQQEAMFATAERGYVRLGDIPASGHSRNRATGNNEAGVSVFVADIAPDGRWRPVLTTNQQLGSYLSLLADNRPAYRVYGEAVGTGGDGEPVMHVERIERLP